MIERDRRAEKEKKRKTDILRDKTMDNKISNIPIFYKKRVAPFFRL